ncbi:MAG TPA: alpha/beta hydrolase [Hyphomicrobiales bacterium]|nr:alpha/beta hydrolase [Hyphomicrobiales bacterium]
MRRAAWALVIAAIVAGGLYLVGGLEVGAIERAFPPVGTFVSVPGGRLQVLDLGREHEDAGTLVLVHGATSNLEEMALGLGRALAARYRVVLVDRPGHGWSDRPDGPADASPARQAALIAAALDGMHIGKAIIVGHSWGGTVALAMALDQPAHVGGLVLISPAAEPDLGGNYRWYVRSGATQIFASLPFDRIVAVPLGLLFLHAGAAAVFAPTPVPADFVQEAALPLMLRPSQLRADAEDLAALDGWLRGAAPRWSTIHVPTLVVTGDRDRVVDPARQAEVVARAIPGARLVVVPHAGHLPQYADPVAVETAIGELAGAVSDAAQPVPPAAAEDLRRDP